MTLSRPRAPRPRDWRGKLAAIFAAGMVLGFGTCGVGFWSGNGPTQGWTIRIGVSLFWLSFASLIVLGIITAVCALMEAFRK